MVRDEVLCTFNDPGEVTDAQLTTVAKREGDRQARRVAERPEVRGERTRLLLRRPRSPQPFGPRKVKAEQLAAVISHTRTS
jgi:hypothetical protein